MKVAYFKLPRPQLPFHRQGCRTIKYLKSISECLGRNRLPKAHTLARPLFLLAPNFCRCQGESRLNLTLVSTEGCPVMPISSLWYFKLGNMRP